MSVIRYGKGRGSVELSGELKAMVQDILKEAAPAAKEALDAELGAIASQARRRWPVRQEKYGQSQDSRGRIETGIRIIPPATIEGYIANSAPYAWAIKSGRDSKTPVPRGLRVADELLWKPVRRRSKAIADRIADGLMQTAKRAK